MVTVQSEKLMGIVLGAPDQFGAAVTVGKLLDQGPHDFNAHL